MIVAIIIYARWNLIKIPQSMRPERLRVSCNIGIDLLSALTIRMASVAAREGQEKKRGMSRLVSSRRDGPLFSMRVRNLASSQQRACGKKRRTHYLCLSAFMDVEDCNSRYIPKYLSCSLSVLTCQILRFFPPLSIDQRFLDREGCVFARFSRVFLLR